MSDSWPEDWPIAAIQEIETRDDRIAELECNRITEEQIDAAWARMCSFGDCDNGPTIRGILRSMLRFDLGIVACSECGGDRQLLNLPHTTVRDCPACHRNGKSHGWVWAEKP